MLCDECQVREATVHITTCYGNRKKESEQTNLCPECWVASDRAKALAPPKDLEATLQAGCRYCGGEPCLGGFDALAAFGGVRKWRVMCRPCTEEYFGFLEGKLPGLGQSDRTPEQLTTFVAKAKACNFPAMLVELDEHMKRWVAKRKSP